MKRLRSFNGGEGGVFAARCGPATLDKGGLRCHQRPKSWGADSLTKMMQFILKLFTWWNSQTFGTQVWTSLYGEFVGEDEQGNRYYRTKGGEIDPTLGFERRWVI